METQWIFTPIDAQQEVLQQQITTELGVSPVIAKILVQRGITTFEEARLFFRPDLSQLHDPFLMKDMDKAVDRLNLALAKKEGILIYGDYDVDGTTAVALVYTLLQRYTSNIDFYIPDRYTEGYGISYQGIDYAKSNGYSLIIALDCGIKAIEKVDYAKKLGIDFIICDHHTPDDELPQAVAVLDSKRSDCTYPYEHLSGCGVGFKLMQAFAQNNNIDFSRLKPLLDLVVVSIASDIVPITGENRVLAYFGLKQLNENPRLGLKSIINLCGLTNKDITISDIVFKIGPRINASGRIQSAREVVELLVSRDADFAREKSDCINNYNDERRNIDKQTTEEAKLLLGEIAQEQASIVIYNPEWHKGIVGIVASRLAEEYYRPTVVLTLANGFVSGSARSVTGFDIYKAIDSCRDLLENFGGHIYAAGLTLKESNLEEFKKRFEAYVQENILPEQKTPQIEIDSEITFKEITPKFFRILRQCGPFGPGNMKPVFCTRRVFDYEGNSRLVGRDQEHLKLEMVDSSCENVMNGIAFRMKDYNDDLKAFNPLDICYTIEENVFNGNTSMQLQIRDIKLSQTK
ncbi:MAG TPA: single-stranded-DNA-specific exonuclease RecJ [Paludibacteraceae bacterium]|nr:single-stranded-DNA-specific exonuclease RecJ [Paludibacteraceae bacterium]HOS36697.1 single-stranded-DNA-specific exonuclease RecJ [Paludibacteraceae bacterium]HPK20161.1 single-stranded-DNA-specific exonuclease RecJ [Paludibacteraceae bacterium]